MENTRNPHTQFTRFTKRSFDWKRREQRAAVLAVGIYSGARRVYCATRCWITNLFVVPFGFQLVHFRPDLDPQSFLDDKMAIDKSAETTGLPVQGRIFSQPMPCGRCTEECNVLVIAQSCEVFAGVCQAVCTHCFNEMLGTELRLRCAYYWAKCPEMRTEIERFIEQLNEWQFNECENQE